MHVNKLLNTEYYEYYEYCDNDYDKRLRCSGPFIRVTSFRCHLFYLAITLSVRSDLSY